MLPSTAWWLGKSYPATEKDFWRGWLQPADTNRVGSPENTPARMISL